MKSADAFSTIVILVVCFASFVPSEAAKLAPAQTLTITTIVRVTTTIDLNATFSFQSQGTYRIPILVVNATLLVVGDGLKGVIAGQPLSFNASWGQAVDCTTDTQGVCHLTFGVPPLGAPTP